MNVCVFLTWVAFAVAQMQTPPTIRVPEHTTGMTIVEYTTSTNMFTASSSDHFLVQKVHKLESFGDFPWKCTLFFATGTSVEQFFVNPRYDVEERTMRVSEHTILKFKGKYDIVDSLVCEEMMNDGNFHEVIQASKSTEAAVGVSPFEGETETRFYQRACEGQNCEDYYLIMPVVGSGYTSRDKELFFQEATRNLNNLFTKQPLTDYKAYFHIPMIFTAEPRNGIVWDNDPLVTTSELRQKNTVYGTRKGRDGNRCLRDEEILVPRVEAMGYENYDVIVLFLHDAPGGYCRPNYSWARVVTQMGTDEWVLVHEMGHFFNLADEYYEFGRCGTPFTPPMPTGPNMDVSGSLDTSKWRHWADQPDIDYHEGGAYCERGVFRPEDSSVMGSCKTCPFNSYFKEVVVTKMMIYVEMIHSINPTNLEEYDCDESENIDPNCASYFESGWCTSNIDFMTENCKASCGTCFQTRTRAIQIREPNSETFSVNHIQNSIGTVSVTWTINGEVAASESDSFTVVAANWAKGKVELIATVHDDSPYVRKDMENVLQESRTWHLELLSADADTSVVVPCALPESQTGYSIAADAILGDDCDSSVCDADFTGVECAEGFEGEVKLIGCSVEDTVMYLSGCKVSPQEPSMPQSYSHTDTEFILLPEKLCSDAGRITDADVCDQAGKSIGMRLTSQGNQKNYAPGCGIIDGKLYFNTGTGSEVWPQLCLAEFEEEQQERVCEVPYKKSQFFFTQYEREWVVTNEGAKMDDVFLGWGSFATGKYERGDQCNEHYLVDYNSVDVVYDYLSTCTKHKAVEVHKCKYEITLCVPCEGNTPDFSDEDMFGQDCSEACPGDNGFTCGFCGLHNDQEQLCCRADYTSNHPNCYDLDYGVIETCDQNYVGTLTGEWVGNEVTAEGFVGIEEGSVVYFGFDDRLKMVQYTHHGEYVQQRYSYETYKFGDFASAREVWLASAGRKNTNKMYEIAGGHCPTSSQHHKCVVGHQPVEITFERNNIDNYGKGCYNHGCNDDTGEVCAYCGTHNGEEQLCCHPTWKNHPNCENAQYKSGVTYHHCVYIAEPTTTTTTLPDPNKCMGTMYGAWIGGSHEVEGFHNIVEGTVVFLLYDSPWTKMVQYTKTDKYVQQRYARGTYTLGDETSAKEMWENYEGSSTGSQYKMKDPKHGCEILAPEPSECQRYSAIMNGPWIGADRDAEGFPNIEEGSIVYFTIDGSYTKMVEYTKEGAYVEQRYIVGSYWVGDFDSAKRTWRSASGNTQRTYLMEKSICSTSESQLQEEVMDYEAISNQTLWRILLYTFAAFGILSFLKLCWTSLQKTSSYSRVDFPMQEEI